MTSTPSTTAAWPSLRLSEWADTKDTLHMWTQIVGKVRLALAPHVNHWWNVTLYVTARGLTTSAMPYRGRTVEMSFDFIDEVMRVETSDGAVEEVALHPRSVADFYHATMDALRRVGVDVRIWPHPVEVTDPIPFAKDETHGSYDADAVRRLSLVLAQSSHVMQKFRGRFIGKCSPVHFWWGSFDLSCTRFSGRPAPRHPGGIPNCPDYVTLEAYSHECISAGWWPGGGPVDDASFYAYAYPEPEGCSAAPLQPPAATYHPVLREWVLPYESVRLSATPEADLLAFLESTYDAPATLGKWDRAALEVGP
jgi:hypothetical protein